MNKGVFKVVALQREMILLRVEEVTKKEESQIEYLEQLKEKFNSSTIVEFRIFLEAELKEANETMNYEKSRIIVDILLSI